MKNAFSFTSPRTPTTRSSAALMALGLALTLAACGQQTASVPSTGAQLPVSTTGQDTAETGAYLVGFRETAGTLGTQSVGTLSVEAQALTVQSAGGTVTSHFADISALAARLTPAALARLKADPNVEYVEPDYQRHAQGFRSGVTDAGVKASGLSSQAVSAQAVRWTASGETTWGDAALRVPTLRTNT